MNETSEKLEGAADRLVTNIRRKIRQTYSAKD